MAKKKTASPRRGKVKKTGDGAASFEEGGAVAPKFFDAAEVGQELGAWWLSNSDAFLMQDNEGRWHKWSQQSMIDEMRALPGRLIAIKARDGEPLSEAKQVLRWIRRNRAVDTAMTALPGYRMGVYDLPGGERVLVKRSPVLIEPEPRPWPRIREIVEGLLGSDGSPGQVDQTPWFWSECKCWYRAFMSGSPDGWKQGHALIFTGPAGCGKNLVQELILTPLIGGRWADPLKFMMDEDQFNGDMMVEHWMLSEIPSSQRTEDRVKFAERIKQLVANRTMRARLMRSEPSTIQPFVRLSISVNDDSDTLRSLPVVSSGYGDKITIFHCRRTTLPILGDRDLSRAPVTEGEDIEPGGWDDEDEMYNDDDQDDTFLKEKEIRRVIAEEMPGFIYWLLNEWKIPGELLKPVEENENPRRFGFRSFHHPVIKSELFEDTPQAKLLRLIDMATLKVGDKELKIWELGPSMNHEPLPQANRWWERAETLQRLLTGESGLVCNVETMVKELLRHNKLDRLLSKLAGDEAVGGPMGRVYKDDKATKTRDWRGWWINAPK